MVEYDDTTGLPRYYDYVVCNDDGEVQESFANEETANEYMQKHQLDEKGWYVGCDEKTAWYCRKRVGTFYLEEHTDLAEYECRDDEVFMKMCDKAYTITIREVTTMHEDDLFIPWIHAVTQILDDGFAEDLSQLKDRWNQYRFKLVYDDYVRDGTDTYGHVSYWEDWESVNYFEEFNIDQ